MKTKHSLTIALLLFCLCNINAQNNFVKLYGGSDTDYGMDIIQTTNNSFVITGQTSNRYCCFIKLDQYGELQYEKTIFDSSFNSLGLSIVGLNDGDFVLSAIKYIPDEGIENSLLCLVRTNENGDTLWTQEYDTTTFGYNNKVCITADNGFVLCANKPVAFPENDKIFLIKTDENGDVIWSNYFTPEHDGFITIRSLKVVVDGYLICGELLQMATHNAFVNKYSLDGEIIWSKTFHYNGVGEIFFKEFIETNGGYVLTGTVYDADLGRYIVLLMKIDDNGNEIWRKEFINDQILEKGCSIVETLDGCFVIACNGSTPALLKTSNVGETIWSKSFTSYDEAIVSSLKYTEDFGFIMVGSAYENIENGDVDIFVAKLDSEGGLIIEELHQKELNVFPNPVNRLLSIESEIEFEEVKILNSIGQIVATWHYYEKIKATNLDINKLIPGVYYLRIKSDKIIISKKIIKT